MAFFEGLKADWTDADAIAIQDGAVALTYGDLDAATGRVASTLVDLGLRTGDSVCLALPKSAAQFVIMLGALRAGLVIVPVKPDSPAEVIADQISRTAPCLLIGDAAGGETIWAYNRQDGTIRFLAAYPDEPCDPFRKKAPDGTEAPKVADEAGALILFSSGSTGKPKAVVHSHGALLANVDALKSIWGLEARDRLLHVLPTTHAHGLIVAPMPILRAGGTVILRPSFEPNDTIAWLPKITCFMGVPFHYAQLLQHRGFTAAAAPRLRLAICGSAPLPAATKAQVEARLGMPLLERYGMTETMIMTANNPSHFRAGSVGQPLPGWSLRISSLGSDPTGLGRTFGEVEVRGPLSPPRYLDDQAEHAKRMSADGFFRTGDVGWLDADGFLHLSGRADDLIIYAGLNVQPDEVEAQLLAVEGVQEACVFGVPHPKAGQAIMSAVVIGPGTDLTPATIRDGLIGNLPATKIPKRVFILSSLPRNAMGKLRRDLLRSWYLEDKL